MRTAIEDYLEREERYELEKSEDMQRFDHYQLTGEVIDQSKVEAWLEDLSHGKTTQCPR